MIAIPSTSYRVNIWKGGTYWIASTADSTTTATFTEFGSTTDEWVVVTDDRPNTHDEPPKEEAKDETPFEPQPIEYPEINLTAMPQRGWPAFEFRTLVRPRAPPENVTRPAEYGRLCRDRKGNRRPLLYSRPRTQRMKLVKLIRMLEACQDMADDPKSIEVVLLAGDREEFEMRQFGHNWLDGRIEIDIVPKAVEATEKR